MALLIALVLAFVAVIARLTVLQVVSPDDYAARGVAQRLRNIPLPAQRGSIFDRNGDDLALSVRQQTVWADPRLVADPSGAAAALAPVLGVDVDELEADLRTRGAFVYLARQVEDAVASEVEALDLDGIGLLDEPERFLPAGDVARSLIGSVDVDNNGVAGLELVYDELLAGRPGELLIERGPDGRTIAAGEHRVSPAERGDDLVLTIDRSLQFEAERALVEQVAATGAQGGMAVVADPRTGEILAMANVRAGAGDEPPRSSADNMAVTSVFEPGSVSKVITLAAALEKGLYEPDDVLTVPDELQVSVKRFSDHDPHPPGRWTVSEILTRSSNVGTIMIAQDVGKAGLGEYLTRFGLGQPVGLDFPGASTGLMPPDPDQWSGTDIGSVAIGQGIAVTALQMLQVFNAVANGGVQVEPTLLRATVDGDGEEQPAPRPEQRRVVSKQTAKELTEMMAEVVASPSGTGANARIEGYTVAGKTGTARKPSTTSRGYEPGAYVATFAGFVPAEDPQIAAIVVLDEPHPYYGGVVAAPVFSRISKYALRQLRVPPPAVPPLVEPAPHVTPAAASPRD